MFLITRLPVASETEDDIQVELLPVKSEDFVEEHEYSIVVKTAE